MILDLRYLDIIGPGRVYYSPGNPGFVGSLTVFRDLEDGESAESLADEAAAELAANLNTAYGTDFEAAESNPPSEPDLPPPPAPTQEEQLLQKNLAKAAAAPRIMARWTTYNEQQLILWETSGGKEGWDPSLFASFLAKVGTVTTLLYATAFSAVKQIIKNFDDPLATPEAKEAYLAAMDEEIA